MNRWLSFAVFLIMGQAVFALTNVDDCMDLVTPGETYVLTADLTGNQSGGMCLNILADDVTIDCDGHSITGDLYGAEYIAGIYGGSVSRATIQNCVISEYYYAIRLQSSHDATVAGNTMSLSDYPVYGNDTDGISITENTILDLPGQGSFGSYMVVYLQDTLGFDISGNTIDSTAVTNTGTTYIEAYLSADGTINGNELYNAGGIYVHYSDDVEISGNVLDSTNWGIWAEYCEEISIGGNTINSWPSSTSTWGAGVSNTYIVGIYDNTISDVKNGIYSGQSEDVYIHGNVISGEVKNPIALESNIMPSVVEDNRISSSHISTGYCAQGKQPKCSGLNQIQCQMTVGCMWTGVSCIQGIIPLCGLMDESTCKANSGCKWIAGGTRDDTHIMVLTQSGVEIVGNRLTNSPDKGIHTTDVDSPVIKDNKIYAGQYAIHAEYSDFADISGNLLRCEYGMYVDNTDDAEISDNDVNARQYGIYVLRSSGNLVHNNIFRAPTPAYDETFAANLWNAPYDCSERSITNGMCRGGNFYSDYSGIDSDGDGIGDVPYPIPNAGMDDDYPLVYPPSEDKDRKTTSVMALSYEFICPGDLLEVSAMSGNSPLQGAEIRVMKDGLLVENKLTDNSGTAGFQMTAEGNFEVRGYLSGYQPQEIGIYVELCESAPQEEPEAPPADEAEPEAQPEPPPEAEPEAPPADEAEPEAQPEPPPEAEQPEGEPIYSDEGAPIAEEQVQEDSILGPLLVLGGALALVGGGLWWLSRAGGPKGKK